VQLAELALCVTVREQSRVVCDAAGTLPQDRLPSWFRCQVIKSSWGLVLQGHH
jgi:hypothetical protein